ncbi:hypothetical protein ACFQZJ_08685 [Maribacter chungangensis]|uniref:Right-handed parallel beta-helix repeat-containing protein n=1 Tax=Maribacter chungangensis TaxID=1069117 RepID=A0ABW3B4L6_9FLAO
MRTTSLTVVILLGIVLWSSSCRKNFEYAPSAGNLSFSRDTVFLDTVFNTIGSSTYALKIYNETRDDVAIPSIRLSNGPSSFYRLNVDGVAGKSFQNIPMKARDSMFVFIETTANIDENPENSLLYTDAIVFDSGIDQQEVALVTLVKDAVFLYPSTNTDGTKETIVLSLDDEGNEIRTEGFELRDDQLRFTNDKPYVIYGYAAVPPNRKLIIDAGARVHFHKDSGLLVQEEASISINGELSLDTELMEGEVIFEGDRLEPAFSETPGQWGSIWLKSGSVNNTIDYLTIKNGSIGLFIEGDNQLLSPTLVIKNSRIFNNSRYNVWGRSAFIEAKNVVLGSAGSASLYCNLGGNYSFTHCTIANYWNKGFRTRAALEIDNFIQISETNMLTGDLIQADFKNCIIDGNSRIELALGFYEGNAFNYNFSHCLLKFDDFNNQHLADPLYNFENNSNYRNMVLNMDPDFFFPARNDFRIGQASGALSKGALEFAQEVPLDIFGKDRTASPDIGTYQATDKE